MQLSRTARYYRNNPGAREVKKKYDTDYHASPSRRKYRAFLNRARRKRGLRGNPKDLSHQKDGSLVLESKSANRARNGHDNKSTKK